MVSEFEESFSMPSTLIFSCYVPNRCRVTTRVLSPVRSPGPVKEIRTGCGLMLMWPRSEPLPPHWLTVHTQNNIIKINEDQRLASPSHGRRSRQYGRICTIAAARMGKPESNFPLACESLSFTSSAGVQIFLKKFV